MPSTYLSLHYHIVFGTKNREPLIPSSFLESLHAYLGGTIKGVGGSPQGVGGVADHVHILMGLPATLRLADVVRELKKASSVWMGAEKRTAAFAWQNGYAAFSVSATSRTKVQRYICNQAEHHQKISFREELIKMLGAAAITYDERFLD